MPAQWDLSLPTSCIRETLENPEFPRENGAVIVGQDRGVMGGKQLGFGDYEQATGGAPRAA